MKVLALQGKGRSFCSLILFPVVFICLLSVEVQAAQKKGFRGGERSYGIKVEANPVGTNLFYKLPEAKAKSSSPMDWKVDNDNANMVIGMNSPIAAFVYTTNPKFNVQGQWPGYQVNLKLPKDVKTAKKNELGKVGNVEPSGLGNDLSMINPKTPSSGSGDLWSGSSEGSSSSGASELVPESGEDLTGFERTVSGDGEESQQRKGEFEEEVREFKPTLKRRSKVAHGINTEIQRSKTKTKAKLEDKDKKDDDLFLRKVKHAVEKLRHFDLNDPKTKKSLKAIITHAKRVVYEAKTVLRDVASVVRSVQNFVTGQFDTNEDQEIQNMTILDDGQKAREDAEQAAQQADISARKAEKASEMAKEIADNFWKVAQKSRALTKLGDVVSPHKNPSMKKFVKMHDDTHPRDILLRGEQRINETNILKHFNKTVVKKKQEKTLTGKVMTTRVEDKLSKNATRKTERFISTNKPWKNIGEVTENAEEIELGTSATTFGQKHKGNKKELKSSDNANNKRPVIMQKLIKLSKNMTRQKESKKQVKNDKSRQQQDKRITTTTTGNVEEALSKSEQESLISKAAEIAKKDAKLTKQMQSLITYRVTKLPSQQNKKLENKVKKLTSHFKKNATKSANDINEKMKSVPRPVLLNSQAPKSTQEISSKERKINKQDKDLTKAKSKKLNQHITADQPGNAVAGSYDVELEVEPEKLIFSKGNGKMKEKSIKIKSMTADGKARQISPVTFGKILKAIRKVEGILGFTIEKEKDKSTNESHKIQK